MLDPSLDTPTAMHTVLDFWERAAHGLPRRRRHPAGVGHRHGHAVRRRRRRRRCSRAPSSVDDDERDRASSASTPRSSTTCSSSTSTPAPATATPARTPCPATRTARCSCATSTGSRRATSGGATSPTDVPYQNLTAAFVLDDVDFTRHRLRHVEPHARGLPRPRRRLRPLHDRRLRARRAPRRCPRRARRHRRRGPRRRRPQHYRNIAAMTRDEKIRCGAYVYFTFLRPFAEEAGIADDLDWTVPRDLPEPAYELLSAIEGDNAAADGRRRLLRALSRDEPDDRHAGRTTTSAHDARARSSCGASRGTSTSSRRRLDRRLGAARPLPEPRRGLVPRVSSSARARQLVAVIDLEVPLPTGRRRSRSAPHGLWADHIVRDAARPLDDRQRGVRARRRRPGRAVRRPCPAAIGSRSAFDLEWETDGDAVPLRRPRLATRSRARVHGEILVGDERIELDGYGQRDHSWGVRDWWQFGWCWTAGRLDDGTALPRLRHPHPGHRHRLRLRAAGDGPIDRHQRRSRRRRTLGRATGFPTDGRVDHRRPRARRSSRSRSRLRCSRCERQGQPLPEGAVPLHGRRRPRAGLGWTEWNQPVT